MTRPRFRNPSVLALAAALLAGAAGASPETAVRRVFDRAAESVVSVSYKASTSTFGQRQETEGTLCGIIVTDDGLVVVPGSMYEGTWFALLGAAGEDPEFRDVRVSLTDGRTFAAEPLGWDRDTSLAFLRLVGAEGERLPVANLARRPPRVAEPVIVVGLLPEGYTPTRTFAETRINAVLEQPAVVATTVDRLRPFVGGPVVSLKGEVLGLVGRERALEARMDLGLGDSLDSPEVDLALAGFVMPVSRFEKLLETPPSSKDQSAKGFLGIEMQPISRELASVLGLPQESGIHVTTVIKGTPAQDAGLRPGDILLRLDGRPIEAFRDVHLEAFRRWVRSYAPGSPVRMEIWRGDEVQTVPLVIGESPRMREDANTREAPALGLTVRELTLDVLLVRSLSQDTPGVVVHDLESAGPAHLGKVALGDIIQRIDGAVCEDLDAFDRLVEEARKEQRREILLFVRRDGETLFLNVKPDWTVTQRRKP